MRKTYAKDEAIFTLGDAPEYLYVVEAGAVDIVLPTMSEPLILATFEAGSFFGELAVFDHQPRTASARAATETTLTCIPHEVVADLIERHPAAAMQFIGAIAARLRLLFPGMDVLGCYTFRLTRYSDLEISHTEEPEDLLATIEEQLFQRRFVAGRFGGGSGR